MSEPDFISQTDEPMTTTERRAWIDARIIDGKAKGARYFQASVHPTIPNLTLVEGWLEDPIEYGSPHWQLQEIPSP